MSSSINVPKTFQDFDDDDPGWKFHAKRYEYWNSLRQANADYRLAEHNEIDFEQWMIETWGLKMQYDHDKLLTCVYEIVDEMKYTGFVLKYRSR